MTKHKIGMVTRNVPHLVIVIFSDEVVKMKFLLIFLDRYLLNVVIDNRYVPRGNKENVLSIAITGNVTLYAPLTQNECQEVTGKYNLVSKDAQPLGVVFTI